MPIIWSALGPDGYDSRDGTVEGRCQVARKKSLDLGPVLRSQILESASRLFYERGYAATSIRDIAVAVGISSSTMYHHFTNKQEILAAVVTRFMSDFNGATIPLLEDRSRSPIDRLRDVIAIHIEMSDDRRQELLVGNPVRYALDPDQRKQVLGQQAQYNAAVRELIDEGRSVDIFHVSDPGLATMAVLDMLNGIREWFHGSGRLDRSTVIQEYMEFALRLLGASHTDPAPTRTLDTQPPR
ncbi:MAG: TetR/AcrR family transcriptional regulator [Comamonadaceae bacterium]|nr:MAG: TetR/AcrR family transcriptional regulator [Comamonadaceae bacterium]